MINEPRMQADQQIAARQRRLGLLSRADVADLRKAWEALADKPDWREVRPAEIGLVMARGRIGGSGQAFNLGEVTVSRCAVELASGETGFGQVMGRDKGRARLVALFDALCQTKASADIENDLLTPVAEKLAAEDQVSGEQTAATKVDFFTLVRGED